MTELRTLREEDLKDNLANVLFEARQGHQTRVVDAEGATRVVIGTGDVTFADEEEVPFHWPVGRPPIDVDKLRKHSREQRKHLRWFNHIFENMREAGWYERYLIQKQRADELELQVHGGGNLLMFLCGAISSGIMVGLIVWLAR